MKTTANLPDKARQVLTYLQQLHPRVPTHAEIQAACRLSSPSVVGYQLQKLEEAGFLQRGEERRARNIRLIEVAHPVEVLRIELPWVPPAEVRGNFKGHHMVRSRATSEMQELGIQYGLEAKGLYPANQYPLTGELELLVQVANPKRIDYDNALIGLKGVIDALQVVIRKDRFGDVEGAGVIVNDSQIVRATIETKQGEPHTSIIISRRPDA